ncbi:MAG: hypothetical protein K6E33_01360 [Lachnospiraceae bacterium]|nr:hypothetical protein [Lachnospiraceae bacterium]
MHLNSKGILKVTGTALVLTMLLALGRAVSIPARSAYSSPYYSISVNTLSFNSVLSSNRLRKTLSSNTAEDPEDASESWTSRTYKETEIFLPAGAGDGEGINSSGRITGGSGVSFSSDSLLRMQEVLDASGKLME